MRVCILIRRSNAVQVATLQQQPLVQVGYFQNQKDQNFSFEVNFAFHFSSYNYFMLTTATTPFSQLGIEKYAKARRT